MPQETHQENITLVRAPRGANSFIPPKFESGADGLEMKWDYRVQAWEIVTRTGRVEFRIGRVVNGKVMVTLYVTDNQPAEDDLSNRAARWMDRIRRRGDDLGEWVGPANKAAADEGETTAAPGREWEEAITVINGENSLLSVGMEILTGSSLEEIKGNPEQQEKALKRGRQLVREAAAHVSSYYWLDAFPYLADKAGYDVSDMSKRPVYVAKKV